MAIENIILIMSICIGILIFCIYVMLMLKDIYRDIQSVYLKIISVENDCNRLQNNMYSYGSNIHIIRTMVEDMAVQDSYSLKDKIKLYLREKLVVD
jgi:hypothetical protein